MVVRLRRQQPILVSNWLLLLLLLIDFMALQNGAQ